MNRSMFLNTKWDVREWTDEMKQKWNSRVMALGFEVLYSEPTLLNSTHLWLNESETASYMDNNDVVYFLRSDAKEMKYEDMFPEEKEVSTWTDEEKEVPPFIMIDDIFTQMKAIAKENSMFISFDGLNDDEEDVIVVTHVSSDIEYVVNDINEFNQLAQSFKALEKFERKI